MATRHRRGETGATLIEAMIALTIMTIGLLGLMQLQVLGIYSNQGARANTTAAQLGRELLSGLEALDPADGRLGLTTSFGPLLQANGTVASGKTDFSDSNPVPGVRLDATIERDPQDGTKAIYQRRWTVQDAGDTGTGVAVRRLAVSVIWRERGLARPRELVLYGQRANVGMVLSNAAAYR